MAAAEEFIEFLGNQLAKGTGMVGVIVLHLVLLVSISVSQVKQLTFNKYKCCLGSLLQLKHIHVLLVAVIIYSFSFFAVYIVRILLFNFSSTVKF